MSNWTQRVNNEITAVAAKARDIYNKAQAEGDRELSRRERAQVSEHMAELDRLQIKARGSPEGGRAGRGGDGVDPRLGRLIPRGVTMTDQNAGVGSGWGDVAQALTRGEKSVTVPTESLLWTKAAPVRSKGLTDVDLVEGSRYTVPMASVLGADLRFLYRHLPSQPVANELAVSDYRQTGERTVNGSVERDLTATSEKATLDLELSHVTENLRQVAVVIENVPNALLEGVGALTPFLNAEAQFQLSAAIDAHCIDAIQTSNHAVDARGEGVVARVRNALTDHRSLGYAPSILAVPGEVAAELDLLAFDAGGYVFDVHQAGSSSPLFGLQVIEVAGLMDTFLIDPTALGVLVLGATRVDTDASKGFSTNLTQIRVEASVLYVLRNAQAVYEVVVLS